MRLGSHVSVAGGVQHAVRRALEIGCDTFQIFTKSNLRWHASPLTDAQVQEFRRLREQSGIEPVFAHSSYLINLASGDPSLWKRSWRSCREEMERCQRLGLDGLVVHPGAHGGDGIAPALERILLALGRVVSASREPRILLETTAGQGTAVGSRLEQLGWLMERTDPERVGVCLDSCHLHAAGYDLSSERCVRQTVAEIETRIGFDRVALIHLNDSVQPAGSRRDRHAAIGEGTIGLQGFAGLLGQRRIRQVPGILETPKGADGQMDSRNLARLRALLAGELPEI